MENHCRVYKSLNQVLGSVGDFSCKYGGVKGRRREHKSPFIKRSEVRSLSPLRVCKE